MGLYKYKSILLASTHQKQFIEGDDENLFKLRGGHSSHQQAVEFIDMIVAQVCAIQHIDPAIRVKQKAGTRSVKIEQPAAGYEVLLSEQQTIAIGWFIEAFLTTNIGERYRPLRNRYSDGRILKLLFDDVAGNILAGGINDSPKKKAAQASMIEIAKTLGLSPGLLRDGSDVFTIQGEIIGVEDYADTVGIGLEPSDPLAIPADNSEEV